jgi:DNA-binding NarL/FixJ family response regulator
VHCNNARCSVLGYTPPSSDSLNFDQSKLSEPELMRKILVYGRQVFASMAFCEMLSKEFSDRIIVNANSSEALDDLEPNLIDLVVVTTSAASNQSAMTALSTTLFATDLRPALAIIGDVGFATKPEEAKMLNLRGVFPDDSEPSIVLAGLRFILSGGQYFPHHINELDDTSKTSVPPVSSDTDALDARFKTERGTLTFTAREFAVLKCVAKGMSNKAISRELGIAENTTKIHMRGILRKLGCANRTEAALLVQQLNLIEAH